MIGWRLIVAPRLAVSRRLAALTLAGGLVAGLTVSAIFLVLLGVPANDLLNEFVVFTLGDPAGLDQVAVRAIPLTLVGLSVAMALQVKFWNIGVEGQLWMGAVGATAVAVYQVGPLEAHLPLMMLGAVIFGGIWCAVTAVGRIYMRADEVITTLLMNYIGYLFTQHLLYGAWRNPGDSFPVSVTFNDPFERLPQIGFGHVHAGLFVALLAVVFCHWLVSWSPYGLMARAIAASPTAARAAGVRVNAVVIGFATLAGALSGLAGFCQVAGNEYKLTQFVGNDYIFPSIVIAFLGRGKPLGVLIAAIFIATLYTAGDSLKAFYQIPGTVIVTIEATLLLVIAAFDFFLRYRPHFVRVAPAETTQYGGRAS